MKKSLWVKKYTDEKLSLPVAVVGSPGLRSIGKLVVESLAAQTPANLVAELYSTHLPSTYETKPSYLSHPALPGMGGVIVKPGDVDLPKIQFYACAGSPLVLVNGYHANFDGQYEVAEEVLELLKQFGVKRVVVVAGYGSKEKKFCCAASNREILAEFKQKFGVDVGYKGPFMGFSGLVFGLASRFGMEAVCLFTGTEPKENDLEFPDTEASARALEKLREILGIPMLKSE